MTQVTLQQLDQEQPEGPKALLGHFGAAQSQPGLPAAGAGGISKPAVLLGAGQELGQAARLLPISAGMLQGHRHPNVTVCSKPKGPPPSPRARFSHLFGDKWDKRPLPLRKGTAPGLRAGREGQLGELSWGGVSLGHRHSRDSKPRWSFYPTELNLGPKFPWDLYFMVASCRQGCSGTSCSPRAAQHRRCALQPLGMCRDVVPCRLLPVRLLTPTLSCSCTRGRSTVGLGWVGDRLLVTLLLPHRQVHNLRGLSPS